VPEAESSGRYSRLARWRRLESERYFADVRHVLVARIVGPRDSDSFGTIGGETPCSATCARFARTITSNDCSGDVIQRASPERTVERARLGTQPAKEVNQQWNASPIRQRDPISRSVPRSRSA